MDDIIGILKNFWEKEDYDKLTEIMSGIFVLIAPSFSFIFLYKKELFNNLDFTKLIILCLILNISFLFLIYIFEELSSVYKFARASEKIKKLESYIMKEIEIIKWIEDLDRREECLEELQAKFEIKTNEIEKNSFISGKGYKKI